MKPVLTPTNSAPIGTRVTSTVVPQVTSAADKVSLGLTIPREKFVGVDDLTSALFAPGGVLLQAGARGVIDGSRGTIAPRADHLVLGASPDVERFIYLKGLADALTNLLESAQKAFRGLLGYDIELRRPGLFPDDEYLDIVLSVSLEPEAASRAFLALQEQLVVSLTEDQHARLSVRYVIK